MKQTTCSNNQIADLLEYRTDIALRVGALTDSTLHARALGSSPLYLLASRAYLVRHGTPSTPEQLCGHALPGFAQYELGNSWPLRHGAGNTLQITPALGASSGGQASEHIYLEDNLPPPGADKAARVAIDQLVLARHPRA